MEGKPQKQSLRVAEDLSLPSVQVIVIRANMGCDHCRRRVSQIATKMNGLVECVVDVRRREVVLRGVVDNIQKKTASRIPQNRKRKKKFLAALVLWWHLIRNRFS